MKVRGIPHIVLDFIKTLLRMYCLFTYRTMCGIPLLSPADSRGFSFLSIQQHQGPPGSSLSTPHPPCTPPLRPRPPLSSAPSEQSPPPPPLLLLLLLLLFFFFSRSHRRKIQPDSSLRIGRIHGLAPGDAVKREPASDSAGGTRLFRGKMIRSSSVRNFVPVRARVPSDAEISAKSK